LALTLFLRSLHNAGKRLHLLLRAFIRGLEMSDRINVHIWQRIFLNRRRRGGRGLHRSGQQIKPLLDPRFFRRCGLLFSGKSGLRCFSPLIS
jgi:hypothetical protein